MLLIKSEVARLLNSESLDDLHEAIQQAIALEHATIPPYLFALYSLGASNLPAVLRLREIVRDEMLHMLLACNLLNAVGGKPRIATADFVPNYPAPLPGTIAAGLRVPLAPYSMELVQEIFMELERPEVPLRFQTVEFVANPPVTIGRFYANLKQRLRGVNFDAAGTRQATSSLFAMPEEQQRIVDYESAARAIDFIVTQGEGTPDSPLAGPGPFAHYYRLAELANGRALVINPGAGVDAPPRHRYHYAGELLTFDPAGVIPFRANPRTEQYAEGTAARKAIDRCNRTYSSILKHLQGAFDGTPGLLHSAVEVMKMDFRVAVEVLKGLPQEADNTKPAPCFKFIPDER